MPVEGDGRQGQRGDMEGAVLHKAADVAHGLSKNPCAVHKPDLRETTARQPENVVKTNPWGVGFFSNKSLG